MNAGAHRTFMKWMVGVDLRHGSEGALHWAQWVRGRDSEAEFLAMHAVEIPKGRIGVTPDLELVSRYVHRFVEQRLPGVEVRLFEELPPDEALTRGVAVHRADAMVIGRRSPVQDDTLVRLGAVARRVLRRLVVPTVICPPDLSPDEIRSGPVVVAVRPDDHSAAALAFARTLAGDVGRELAVVSVLPPPFPPGVSYLPAPAYQRDEVDAAEVALRRWLAGQPGPALEPMIGEGSAIPTLLRACDELQATAIVCGSRMLSAVERITQTSVGATLAGTAPIPVVLVPPA